MSVNYGFFRSVSGDRTYTAQQMNDMFSTLVGDGVFSGYENELVIYNAFGMAVVVQPGRAMIGGIWVDVSSTESVPLSSADETDPRYDAIVIHVDKTARTASLISLTGVPSETPAKPELTNTDLISELLLAYVYVPANSTYVSQNNITDERTWVTSLIRQTALSFRCDFTSDGETYLYAINYPERYNYASTDEFDVYVSGLLLPQDVPTIMHGIDGSVAIELPTLDAGTKISIIVRKN